MIKEIEINGFKPLFVINNFVYNHISKKNVLNLCKNESPEKMGVDFLYSSKTSFQELIRAILTPPNKQYRGYGLYKDLAETKFVSFLDFWAKK